MQLARPIGFALSNPLLERLDAIARVEGVSRSSVARIMLVNGLAEYAQRVGASDPFETDHAAPMRPRRPRVRVEGEVAVPTTSIARRK